MSDEPNGTPAAVAEVTPVATPSPSFIDGEGNFKEGWETAYLTEDQRGNARVSGGRVKSVQGLLETVINSDKMISGDKILRPSDSFGDADWDAFHSAGGWKNDPIPITAPEGLPEGMWSDERATTFSEGFNALRLNPKQVAGIVELYNADLMQQVTDTNNNATTAHAELESGLLKEKGNAFAQFKHNGNFAIEKGVAGESPEFKARIVAKYGTDPDLVRFLGNIGGKFNEKGSIPTVDMAPTPADLQTEINKIMVSDAFTKPTHPEHKNTMAKLRQLHIDKGKIRQPA